MQRRHLWVILFMLIGLVALVHRSGAQTYTPMPGSSPAPAASAMPAPQGQPAAAPAPHGTPVIYGKQLVKVSHCDAKLNLMQSGGYSGPMYPGYAYGWGYRGAYWGDVYGRGYYQSPVTTASPEMAVDYTNISHKVMKEIEFGLVANERLVAEVKDVGTFSPGVEIKHKFGVSTNIFPLQTSLPLCPPLRITFADGSKWRNPRLPPQHEHLYQH